MIDERASLVFVLRAATLGESFRRLLPRVARMSGFALVGMFVALFVIDRVTLVADKPAPLGTLANGAAKLTFLFAVMMIVVSVPAQLLAAWRARIPTRVSFDASGVTEERGERVLRTPWTEVVAVPEPPYLRVDWGKLRTGRLTRRKTVLLSRPEDRAILLALLEHHTGRAPAESA